MVLGDPSTDSRGEATTFTDDVEDLVSRELKLLLQHVPCLPTAQVARCRRFGRAESQRRIQTERIRLTLEADEIKQPLWLEAHDRLEPLGGARLAAFASAFLALPYMPAT